MSTIVMMPSTSIGVLSNSYLVRVDPAPLVLELNSTSATSRFSSAPNDGATAQEIPMSAPSLSASTSLVSPSAPSSSIHIASASGAPSSTPRPPVVTTAPNIVQEVLPLTHFSSAPNDVAVPSKSPSSVHLSLESGIVVPTFGCNDVARPSSLTAYPSVQHCARMLPSVPSALPLPLMVSLRGPCRVGAWFACAFPLWNASA